MLAVLKVCVCGSESGRVVWSGWGLIDIYEWEGGWGVTNHLVFQDAIFLVDFGTLCAVASGHVVVELFLGKPLGPVVGAGEAEDAFWLGHDGNI